MATLAHPRRHFNSATAGVAPAGENTTTMAQETRIERRLDRNLAHASTPRGAAIVIASVTTSITILAGALMTVVDKDNFPSIGSGMWWAVQTVTTVGYGDHVPITAAGKAVAAVVMLLGIGFVTVITASITGTFVARSRRKEHEGRSEDVSADQLADIIVRLERIEAGMRRPS
jgi:voltage-gated potassium channel